MKTSLIELRRTAESKGSESMRSMYLRCSKPRVASLSTPKLVRDLDPNKHTMELMR